MTDLLKNLRLKTNTPPISAGIASFPDNVEKAADVLEKADIALYKSKQDGRNKVSYYDEEMESDPASTRKLHLASA